MISGQKLYELVMRALSIEQGLDEAPWGSLTSAERRGWEQAERDVYEEYAPEPEF